METRNWAVPKYQRLQVTSAKLVAAKAAREYTARIEQKKRQEETVWKDSMEAATADAVTSTCRKESASHSMPELMQTMVQTARNEPEVVKAISMPGVAAPIKPFSAEEQKDQLHGIIANYTADLEADILEMSAAKEAELGRQEALASLGALQSRFDQIQGVFEGGFVDDIQEEEISTEIAEANATNVIDNELAQIEAAAGAQAVSDISALEGNTLSANEDSVKLLAEKLIGLKESNRGYDPQEEPSTTRDQVV